MASFLLPSLAVLLLLQLSHLVRGKTDPADVSALNVLYTSLNSPSQFSGWSSSGGDPCGDDWKGITCSGSSVTEIKLSGLGLSGTLGYQLSSLTSVTYFDFSKNNLYGDIPYQLPPNAVHINLAGNTFTGGIPYSISQMTELNYLNLANNQLSGQLTDMFGGLPKLSFLDLSYNHFSGNLPQSFGSLSKLKTLLLQNNQFSGSIGVLATLSLKELNVQNNHFTGWIPNKVKNIDNLKIDGNSWSSGPAPPGTSDSSSTGSGGTENSSLKGAAIAMIVIAALVVVLFLLTLIKRRSSASSHYIEEHYNQNRSFTPLVDNDFTDLKDSSIAIKTMETSSAGLKTPSCVSPKSSNENEFAIKFNARRSTENEFANKFYSRKSTERISLAIYSLADLQTATGNFSPSCLLGEGSIGCVYKAKFADGKVLAVKKIEALNVSGSCSYDFMEIVSDISKLHHTNIAELLGYCSEPGNKLFVYEYQWNGSLHGFLHLSDEYSRPLTWDTRIRIALGTACAVEYLHEVCSPPVIHKNIKSSSILLDAELNARLADSGFAPLFEDTSKILGAGYNAPECATSSSYTMKSDVYSFGVVMLELLTGRKPFDSSKPIMEQSLVRWAAPQLHDIDALAGMVDPALRGLYPPKSLSRFADVIALCIQAEPEFRPAMSEVVQSLIRCIQVSSFNRRMDGDLGASRRSDDSDGHYGKL